MPVQLAFPPSSQWHVLQSSLYDWPIGTLPPHGVVQWVGAGSPRVVDEEQAASNSAPHSRTSLFTHRV